MKTTTLNYLEEILTDYPKLTSYIHHCEQQMIITSSSGQGMVNTIATDRYLRRLKENQQAVHDCLEQTDPETRQIIHTLYFSPGLRLTLRDVSIQLNMSLATISRKRKRFMNNLGKQLGLTL